MLALALSLSLAVLQDSQVQAPPGEVLHMHDIVADISPDRLYADVETMVGFGTRHTLSVTESDTRGVGAARRWVYDEFQKISAECGGCLEVMYVGDVIEGERRIPEPTEVVNVVALQRGTLDPNRVVLMGGHLDSRASDVMDADIDAPGANDSASGVAAAIEAARVLSKHQFAGTLGYVAFTGEEQGLFGAQILAAHAREQGWEVVGVLNNDMVGNIAGIDGVIDNTIARVFSEGTRALETQQEARIRRFTGGEVDSPSRNLARYVDSMSRYVPNLDVMMIYRIDRFGRGGDHRAFNDAGFPGVRIMETHEHYDRQHQDLRTEDGRVYGDTLEGVDPVYMAKLTALTAVSMAGIAGAPPVPQNVSIEGAVRPSTTLSWTRPEGAAAENLAGYRVHWRLTTDPQWRWSRFVGDVESFTLANIVIDNYFFGVSAVAHDGSETPVVFPGPNGAF